MKKNTIRRIIAAALALIMVLSMTACGKQEPAPAPVVEEPTPVVETPAEEPVVIEEPEVVLAELLDISSHPGAPANVPAELAIDWNARYTFAELEGQLEALNEAYPAISELYSIGASWEERELW